MTKNQVMLYKLLVNFRDDHQDNLAMAMTVQHNLMTFGYMLDENAFEQLKRTDAANIKDFFDECEEIMKEFMGGKHTYTSLYGNFPNDILSMDTSELYHDQIAHYWGKKTFRKKGLPKDVAFEQVTYKVIKGTDESGILEVYKTLAGSGQSLAPMDTKVLKYFAKARIELPLVSIPFKENLAILASILPGFKVQTVVDVLRIAVSMSGGDPSLPPIPKKLKNPGRKADEVLAEREKHKFKLNDYKKARILDLFEASNLSLSDLNQGSRYGKFIRLSEILRVQDHKSTHPLTYEAFHKLKNQKRKGKPDGLPKIRTWYSQVESQFKLGFKEGLLKLSERPGEFLRKLDYLVRTNRGSKHVINLDEILLTLSRIGETSSNKVLFEVYTHFESRINPVNGRSIFIKGARKRTELPTLPGLNPDVINAIQDTIINCIKNKMTTLDSMGNVYIDEELKKIPLPTNMRSLSESLTPIIRGQRLPIEGTGKVIRPFIHWFDERGNEDLDLHGFLIGDTKVDKFGFNNKYSSELGCYSGDVRHRKGACAEYVDLFIDVAKEQGFRYFIPVVHNFTGRPLSSMKDAVAGVMMRENASANMAWIPETISTAMKLTSAATMALIGCYDLETMEYIHLDLDWDPFTKYVNSSGQSGELMKAISFYTSDPKLSVYDLLRWHVEARGTISSKDAADTHFTFDDFKSDYTAVIPWLGV